LKNVKFHHLVASLCLDFLAAHLSYCLLNAMTLLNCLVILDKKSTKQVKIHD